MSTRTLTRAFHRQTGLGFRQWQTRLRIQRAVLLLDTGLSVEEVAEASSYVSPNAFAAAFRRETGMVPSRFLREV